MDRDPDPLAPPPPECPIGGALLWDGQRWTVPTAPGEGAFGVWTGEQVALAGNVLLPATALGDIYVNETFTQRLDRLLPMPPEVG